MEDKVVCRTPTPGREPTRIDRWKFERVREAILAVVPGDPPGMEFKRLPPLVAGEMHEGDLARLGSVSWYTTTVKLEMEVRGELERIEGSSPQRLVRTGG